MSKLTDREKRADRKKAAESAPLTDWQPLIRTAGGTRHYWRDTEDGAEIKSVTDVAPILEQNKAMANHNDGWSPSKELRRVGSIPFALIYKWLEEDKVNVLDAGHDPHAAAYLMRKLNDSQYAYLRTAPGRVGMSNGILR
jgi:hypothetical protein